MLKYNFFAGVKRKHRADDVLVGAAAAEFVGGQSVQHRRVDAGAAVAEGDGGAGGAEQRGFKGGGAS